MIRSSWRTMQARFMVTALCILRRIYVQLGQIPGASYNGTVADMVEKLEWEIRDAIPKK